MLDSCRLVKTYPRGSCRLSTCSHGVNSRQRCIADLGVGTEIYVLWLCFEALGFQHEFPDVWHLGFRDVFLFLLFRVANSWASLVRKLLFIIRVCLEHACWITHVFLLLMPYAPRHTARECNFTATLSWKTIEDARLP